MTIGSLFSGIGGLELGLERAGLGPVVFQCEIDPYCRAVLAKHWPDATRYADVREISGAALPPVDVLCGGFPCQDLSHAGLRAGLEGARSGLWYEFARVVEEARPQAVVVENVRGLLGRPLDVVAGRLSELGYAVEATRILAADVGAPHLRERVFLVAVADAPRGRSEGHPEHGATHAAIPHGCGAVGDAEGERFEVAGRLLHGRGIGAAVGAGEGVGLADALGEGQPQQGGPVGAVRGRAGDGGDGVGQADPVREGLPGLWSPGGGSPELADDRLRVGRAAEPSVGGGPDGLPSGLDGVGPGGAWPAGRGEAQHPWEPPRTLRDCPGRPARLKAVGNAVVPQVAYVVGCRVRDRLRGVSP